ncbi:MAG: hypothetical protein LBK72_01035 [Bifidobacteriaceae bacterium]|jgi:hypothetical protein|nr:hypothetical protein [Bifidobacteriaceae bacterium]
MTAAEIGLLVVGLVAVAWWVIWVSASRLDRLHRRVASARASLARQLVARAVAALDLAHAEVLDPVSSIVVAEAARAALGSMTDDADPLPSSGAVQSELSGTIRLALGEPGDLEPLDPVGEELVRDVAAAWYRVTLARRFYNEAVGKTRRRRRNWPVRLLRLAGRTPMPLMFEMDDALPEALAHPRG